MKILLISTKTEIKIQSVVISWSIIMSNLGTNALRNFSSKCNNFLWVSNQGEGYASVLVTPKSAYASHITIGTTWVSSICMTVAADQVVVTISLHLQNE